MSETITPEVLPPNSTMGSDGRAHHECGFSFVATVEKCAAAARSKHAAKSLASAGERGTELHKILEFLVEDWAYFVTIGKTRQLDAIAWRNEPWGPGRHENSQPKLLTLPVSDIVSIKRVIAELKPYLQPEKGMLLGLEERIDLHNGDGEIVSFGYYDLFLKLGRTVVVIDHKFVRKEVEAAEKNRQGHSLAVSVWQQYEDADDVVVLFTMPECESSVYRFNRVTDELRLFNELNLIFERRAQPYKVLQAGDHCVHCAYRYKCPAALGTVKTMVTGINPLAVPPSFAPNLITTADDMALLRYWADTVEPVITAIKEESKKWAEAKQSISTTVNGQYVEYKVASRALPRKLNPPIEIWNAFNSWLSIEAVLSACDTSITKLEEAVVALLSARLIDEGKTPNASQLAADFTALLKEKGLLSQEEGRTWFLKRVKASAKRKPKGELTEGAAEAPAENAE